MIILYNESFNVKKINNYWKFYHVKTNAKIVEAKTKKEAIKQGTNKILTEGEVNTKEAIYNLIKRKIKNKFFKHPKIQKLFKSIFNVSLNRFIDFTFLSCINSYCLNVITFDKWLNTPDGISTYDFISKKYGVQAKKLVQKLI